MRNSFTKVLSVLVGCYATGVSAQDQLQNGDFEKWENRSQFTVWNSEGATTGVEPKGWNSFLTASSFFSTTPTLYKFAQDQLQRSTDVRPGSSGLNSAKIFSTEMIGIVANGNLTNGTIHMGSMTATNAANFNYTDTSSELVDQDNGIFYDPSEHRSVFTGKPDSVEVWAKFTPVNESKTVGDDMIYNEAQFSFILHGDYPYKEPHATAEEQAQYLVGSSYIRTTATHDSWVRFAQAIEYGALDQQPAYLLASFTTNKTPGSGNGNDQLWVDDLHFIYNTKLRSLLVDGVAIPEFDEDVYTYRLSRSESSAALVDRIDAMAWGKDALVAREAGENNSVVITVTDPTARGEKSRTYTVYFTDIDALSLNLQLPAEISYNETFAPVITGLPEGASAELVADKSALFEQNTDGTYRAAGCGVVRIQAVYRAENQPIAYSNSCVVLVKPAVLTIRAKDVAYKRGSSLPTYGFIYKGLSQEDSLCMTNTFRVLPSATSEVVKTSVPGSVFPITVVPGEAYNYTVAVDPQTAHVTVIKPILKVSAKSVSRAEGSENPAFTYSYSGFVNGEKETTEGVMTTLPVLTCDATVDAVAGKVFEIVISGASSALYDIEHVNGKLTVKKTPGDVVAPEISDVTYGDGQFTIAATGGYEGAVFRYSSSNTKVASVNWSTGVVTIKGSGKTTITVKVNENSEYMPTTDVESEFTVVKAPLTITALDQVRKVGEENPEFELVYDGLVNAETVDKVFPELPLATCVATSESPAGEYEITVPQATAANYEVTPVHGTLTIAVADGMDAVEKDGLRICMRHGKVVISGNDQHETIRIFDAAGRLLMCSEQESISCVASHSSFLVVTAGEKRYKLIVAE